MNCENTIEYLDALNRGELASVPATVQVHVQGCAHCQNNLAEWKKIESLFIASRAPEVPEGLADEILARIEIDGRTLEKPANVIMAPWLVKFALAACLVFALTLGYFFSKNVRTSPEVLGLERKSTDYNVVDGSRGKGNGYRVSVHIPEARTVNIVGDFNKWQKESTPLTKDEKGNWTITLNLREGYWQYQLLIDGKKFLLDPSNPNTVDDGFGAENSVILL